MAASPVEAEIRPVLRDRCLGCHSTAKHKGDLDLESSDIRKEPDVWENVLDQVTSGAMPPKKEQPLAADEKKNLIGRVRGALDQIALANAGDPGPVVLRRLSNMEYTCTLHDLTGVESLDPAKEFPVDGAAGEGFTNAGAALVMSPALLSKYLDAAKGVADHLVLLPEGIRFSPGTSSRDWTDEALAKIRAFYAKHTTSGEGSKTEAQGIKLDTGTGGGHLPLAKYLDALQGRTSSEGLSAKYLGILRAALTGAKPSVLLDPLRAKFREKRLAAADIEPWQKMLWRFANVGHIGKENGPKAWQEPVTPLVARHEMRVKLDGGKDTTLYLSTGDAGDGGEGDEVVWENPRLVAPGRPDLPVGEMSRRANQSGRTDLRARAPSVIEVRVPAVQAEGVEFVATGRLASQGEGSVQMQVLREKPAASGGLVAGKSETGLKKGRWSDNNLVTQYRAPVIVNDGSAARRRFEAAFDEFRPLFPIALCYPRIVPVDEVVTLTLFYREDDRLKRLMLDDAEARELDRLWDELLFVSEAPLKQVDAFEQLWQFATQDAKPSAFEPMRGPIKRGAETFRQRRRDAEPSHIAAVLDFAARAWRRPLSDAGKAGLRSLYEKLREQGLPHATAVRMMLARVLVAPAFLYRSEKAAPGPKAAPVSDWEMATRLSYFLWSSAPDAELTRLAAAGTLHDPEVLAAQAKRMLGDERIRRLAIEFGCQWLHVRDVATLDEKSERHFPSFVSVRESMQEEVTRFFIDLFQHDRSVMSLLDADHTFVNATLAEHYGMAGEWGREYPSALRSAASIFQPPSNAWRRIEGLRSKGRGGILGFAATLAKQAGASRTSGILRGAWVCEVVLGERLPVPPKGVPVLPEQPPEGLTERQLVEKHSTDANCAACHRRIDPFGFSLEGFDAIGRSREADTKVKLPDGTVVDGIAGLRDYLLDKRGDDFLRQFCRKLLGYALGRGVQLSDKPLIAEMMQRLKANEFKVGEAVDSIVRGRQFREIRGASLPVLH